MDTMDEIFELIIDPGKEKGTEPNARLGIRLKLSGYETVCPITKSCTSYEALEMEVHGVENSLGRILGKAKEIFEKSENQQKFGLEPGMGAEEIWSVLSGIKDEGDFVEMFNSLDEDKRREVAEHVLTKCNIFSGNASIFSARYYDKSAFME